MLTFIEKHNNIINKLKTSKGINFEGFSNADRPTYGELCTVTDEYKSSKEEAKINAKDLCISKLTSTLFTNSSLGNELNRDCSWNTEWGGINDISGDYSETTWPDNSEPGYLTNTCPDGTNMCYKAKYCPINPNNQSTYPPPSDGGCKNDPNGIYFNHNPNANFHDPDTCVLKKYGCTDETANNQDPAANTNDNSCTYDVPGCTNINSENYNPSANVDNGSCIPIKNCEMEWKVNNGGHTAAANTGNTCWLNPCTTNGGALTLELKVNQLPTDNGQTGDNRRAGTQCVTFPQDWAGSKYKEGDTKWEQIQHNTAPTVGQPITGTIVLPPNSAQCNHWSQPSNFPNGNTLIAGSAGTPYAGGCKQCAYSWPEKIHYHTDTTGGEHGCGSDYYYRDPIITQEPSPGQPACPGREHTSDARACANCSFSRHHCADTLTNTHAGCGASQTLNHGDSSTRHHNWDGTKDFLLRYKYNQLAWLSRRLHCDNGSLSQIEGWKWVDSGSSMGGHTAPRTSPSACLPDTTTGCSTTCAKQSLGKHENCGTEPLGGLHTCKSDGSWGPCVWETSSCSQSCAWAEADGNWRKGSNNAGNSNSNTDIDGIQNTHWTKASANKNSRKKIGNNNSCDSSRIKALNACYNRIWNSIKYGSGANKPSWQYLNYIGGQTASQNLWPNWFGPGAGNGPRNNSMSGKSLANPSPKLQRAKMFCAVSPCWNDSGNQVARAEVKKKPDQAWNAGTI